MFWEEDWEHILSIPMKQGMDDLLAWQYDKKGVFSIKLEYHVLADEQTREARKQTSEGSSAP